MTGCKALVLYRPKKFVVAVEVEETSEQRRAFAERLLRGLLPEAIAELRKRPLSEIRKVAVLATRLVGRELCRPESMKRTAPEAWDGFATLLAGLAAYAFVEGGVDLLGERFECLHVEGPLDLEGDAVLAFLRALGITIGHG